MLRPSTLNIRQSRILNERMRDMHAVIAGAGMAGSWIALALVRAIGGDVHVYDDDLVAAENIGTQAYDGSHIGLPKVKALSLVANEPPIIGHPWRLPDHPDHETPASDTVVIAAVDTMAARRAIAQWAQQQGVYAYIDVGIHAEICSVKVVKGDYDWYLDTLPTDDVAPDAACGLKGTAYAGMAIAAYIVPLINQLVSNRPVLHLRVWHAGLQQIITEEGGDVL